MIAISPKLRVALTVLATVLAALLPLVSHAPALTVAGSAALTFLAAIGIIPSHLEVTDDE